MERSGGLDRMLIDDGVEMERRNDLSGHMTRDSASTVSVMRPALDEREREREREIAPVTDFYLEREPGGYREIQNLLKLK